MTNRDAINLLEEVKILDDTMYAYNPKYLDALDMALTALEQPEIIRCEDCLHWVRTCGDDQWGLGDCDVFDKHLVMCEGYCAWAERREE